MKSIINLLILLLIPLTGFTTAQVGDFLIYNGDTLTLYSNPLEQYLANKSERTMNGSELNWTSTACYRGYQATWKLADDNLFLMRIQKGCFSDKPEYFDLKEEFGSEVVFARWFTGELLLPGGELIHFVNNDYGSFHEKGLVLSFQKGVLQSRKEYDNSKSYKSPLTENLDSLQNFISSNINWDRVPELRGDTKKVFVEIQSGETTKPGSIQVIRRSDIEILNEEALRVLKSLPEWSVYYKKGEVHIIKWIIPVVFSEEMRNKYSD